MPRSNSRGLYYVTSRRSRRERLVYFTLFSSSDLQLKQLRLVCFHLELHVVIYVKGQALLDWSHSPKLLSIHLVIL